MAILCVIFFVLFCFGWVDLNECRDFGFVAILVFK